MPWFLGLFVVLFWGLSFIEHSSADGAARNVTTCVNKSRTLMTTTSKKTCKKGETKLILTLTRKRTLCVSTKTRLITTSTKSRCPSGRVAAEHLARNNSLPVCTNSKTRRIEIQRSGRCKKGLKVQRLPILNPQLTTVQNSSTTIPIVGTTTSSTQPMTNSAGTTTTTISSTTTSTTTVPTVTTTTIPLSTISSFSATRSTINQGESTTLSAVWSGATANINQTVGSVVSGQNVTVSPTVTTVYRLTVSNGAGHSLFQDVTVFVNSLNIVTHPQDTTTDNPFGQNLTVNAVATGALTYQWYKNSQPVDHATSSAFRATQDGTYHVVVTSTLNGVTRDAISASATFAMNSVSIANHPTGTIIGDGQTATFTVVATGAGTLSYKWKVNGNEVSGATQDTFTSSTYGSHQVIVTSTLNGMTTSVSSNSAWLDVNTVSITSQPSDAFLTQGGTTSLGVSVSSQGSATISYQWYVDGSPINNANGISVQATQAGTYKVKVTSTRSGTTAIRFSDEAIVTEVPPASISSLTASPPSIGVGSSTDLTPIFAHGEGVLNPGNIPVTSGTPVTVTPTETTEYTLTVTNPAGQQAGLSMRVVVTTGFVIATANNSSADRYYGAQAVTLQSGKVLVFGSGVTYSKATDLYDPDTNLFTRVGDMLQGRMKTAAIRLANGKVLAIGGAYHNGSNYVSLNSVEIFDPATETWSYTGSLNVAREEPLAVLLNDGRVLVIGGYRRAPGSTYINTVEIYDPTTGTFSYAASMPQARGNPTGTLMADGNVFVGSGYNSSNGHMKSAIIYNVASNTWRTISSQMNSVHSNGGASTLLLDDGRVLIAGGWDAGVGVATIDIYNPTTDSFAAANNLPQFSFGRGGLTAHVMSNGLVVFFGGSSGIGHIANAPVLYDPTSNTLTTEANTMRWHRYMHTSAQLLDGRVLIVGGNSTNNSAADVYTQ